jgi:TolB protein
VEEVEATSEPTATPTRTPTVTPTSEPTATAVPLPEYASRDQTLARGETEVSGRVIFPVFDPVRSTYDIYIADAANGANRELVQSNASQPALSADGVDLAYRSWQPDKRGLFARAMSGGDTWQFNPFFESARPQFSPVDKSLIFHSRVGGKEPAVYRVVNGVGEVMRRDGFPVQGESAKWVPNGQQFVYSSCLGGKCGIIRSNIDGTTPVILSDHPTDTSPEVSPDGSTVAFMSKRSGNWEIYTVGIEGGGTINALTSDPTNDGLPTWSPGGDKIAFVADRDGEWSVWDMDPDGGNQRRLFSLGGSIDGVVGQDPPNSRSWTEENIDWAP